MKILAITHNLADPTPHLADETRRTAQLRADRVLEQLYLKADRSGAVLILEAESGEDAERLLATLPVVERGVATLEVTELLVPPQ